MGLNVFVLTGAGISAESGLGTFRDASGIWTQYDLSEVATPEGFARDPAKVRAFYNARRANLAGAAPNAAHLALARLQKGLVARGGRLFLCTQNVDDLHEQGGCSDVVHMHGQLGITRCHGCGATWPDSEPLSGETACARCGETGTARPHVVWFGETPLFLHGIEDALEDSDLFVAIGTSGAVYPAAGLVAWARRLGIRTCELNLEPSDNARVFDERRYGPATEVVPTWVDEVLGGQGARPIPPIPPAP
ncbi:MULTISPECIES: NAD-dependent deacylase [Caulobacter]|uniref:NAD-dependent protein deacylase n=1 Tax=Caulobacter rhizosphaerae TaxID=2010972 RepID=A0ABU1N108_9CAUL|nr:MULTISPECIES: NAD-dependent deacylase [Caulobacter]KQZ29388.1 NAD-dependent deacylase [Caulobacter sp. Root1472]MDR6532135.1 NAD-dependent deacetylase [Caulobacter rhizosphaerae]